MSQIERALMAHPGVTNAVVSIEHPPDGRPFKIAFWPVRTGRW
ncbi:hypothetical protein [Bradyrhizobium centrosematis]|nr:hypothetical protein [Bradyrhizobium centrosematis]MCS3760065.1 acyl-coenzyme A synthetase/AMP-(fatty) acid ligase [Bradyrhizobium centrosematis]MCS3772046.1 acyl-coenzyme A synthetase/AMP-(fatty) acid ligase [Bradyrhizobium centrosematis]